MRWTKWLLALLVSLGGGVDAAHADLPLTKRQLTRHKPSYEIDFEYPHTGNREIDNQIGNWVLLFAEGFERSAKHDHEGRSLRPYTAQLRYEIARNDKRVFAIVFRSSYDLGGAHPNSATFTFNYLMPDAWWVLLPEIIKPDGWPRVSELAIADLTSRIASGPDALSDEKWVRRGAGPESYNFGQFTLLEDEILIHFDPYQVAPHAAGSPAAHIPLSQLQSVLRPDWRAPQPSFDCTKAQSKIEHLLCTNAILARVDRQVSEEYRYRINADPDGAAAAKIRASQREWLAKRDRDCTAAVQMSFCIRRACDDRIAALQRGD